MLQLAIIKKKNWYFRNIAECWTFNSCVVTQIVFACSNELKPGGGRWKKVLAVNFFLEQVSSFKWDLVLVVNLKR